MVTALARDHYAQDKEVIDVEGPPFRPTAFEHELTLDPVPPFRPVRLDRDVQASPPIAIGRVKTEDLIVHVHVDGYWHRLHPSTVKTACGLAVNYARSATRDGRRPEHPLAPPPCDCWTRLERAEADEAYRLKFGRDYEP